MDERRNSGPGCPFCSWQDNHCQQDLRGEDYNLGARNFQGKLPPNSAFFVSFQGYRSLKGQSHEIKVCFFWAQYTEKINLIFPQKGFSS